MNYTELFYWLVVANNARVFFLVFIVIFGLISFISTIAYFINHDAPSDQSMSRKWMWWSYPFTMLFWGLFIFTPSKKDVLLIVAGGQTLNFLTNDTTAQKIPSDVLNFVSIELKTMAKEAQVEIGLMSQKERIIDEAKRMTTDQLLDRIRTDSTFRELITNSK